MTAIRASFSRARNRCVSSLIRDVSYYGRRATPTGAGRSGGSGPGGVGTEPPTKKGPTGAAKAVRSTRRCGGLWSGWGCRGRPDERAPTGAAKAVRSTRRCGGLWSGWGCRGQGPDEEAPTGAAKAGAAPPLRRLWSGWGVGGKAPTKGPQLGRESGAAPPLRRALVGVGCRGKAPTKKREPVPQTPGGWRPGSWGYRDLRSAKYRFQRECDRLQKFNKRTISACGGRITTNDEIDVTVVRPILRLATEFPVWRIARARWRGSSGVQNSGGRGAARVRPALLFASLIRLWRARSCWRG